jgi:hypothetical protein
MWNFGYCTIHRENVLTHVTGIVFFFKVGHPVVMKKRKGGEYNRQSYHFSVLALLCYVFWLIYTKPYLGGKKGAKEKLARKIS